jgi:hypothetical protein
MNTATADKTPQKRTEKGIYIADYISFEFCSLKDPKSINTPLPIEYWNKHWQTASFHNYKLHILLKSGVKRYFKPEKHPGKNIPLRIKIKSIINGNDPVYNAIFPDNLTPLKQHK